MNSFIDYCLFLSIYYDEGENEANEKSRICQIPVKKVTADTVQEYEDCVICQESVKVGQFMMHLPCTHTFHHDCMKPWIEKNHKNTCPMCRYEFESRKTDKAPPLLRIIIYPNEDGTEQGNISRN